MERKDYLARILFVLFVLGYLLVATAEYVWAKEIKEQQAIDSISGVWTGDMGADDATRYPLRMELKFDRDIVSGTVTGPPLPGTIKAGTFDPKTGALKLEVEVKNDGSISRFVFEGTVVKGTATGRVSSDNRTGNFKITKAINESAAAQPSGSNETTKVLRGGFSEVSGWVTKAADLVPADKYTYQPTSSVRTFGQLIGHIADSYNYYCARAAGRNVEWSDAIEKGKTDKATLIPKLKQATDLCTATYSTDNQINPLLGNIGHTNLHYGNIITYMRMMGLVPPSS